jgi:O-antigen/teichoic acid export membrane protein
VFDQLKRLFEQTAVYGLSSILGKVLNFLLVPLHTAVLTQSAYGINTDFYVLIAFLIVILTYGMETAFFRFSEKRNQQKELVYSTALLSILATTGLFMAAAFLFFEPLTTALKYQDNQQYIQWLLLILAMDAIAAIPFARLRAQNRALRFVVIKLTLISSNIAFNLLFFLPALVNARLPFDPLPYWFGENLGVGYIFLANLLASAIMLIMLLPEMVKVPWRFNWSLWKAMLVFGIPLMISGLAGIANEMLDRQLLKYLLPEANWQAQVGIYGAVYKISIFLILFNQAFRYAAEPFFFSSQKRENAKETFAVVMNYFVIVMSIGFVMIMAYLDIVKYFIDSKFWEGLHIVPILLMANVFLGVNTNLSFWYKLSDKTNYAIVITGIGLLLTVGLNVYLIPKIGYEGAAWATLASYGGMMVISYFLGQRMYPIPYQTGRIVFVMILAFLFGYLAYHFSMNTFVPQTAFFIGFLGLLAWLERDALKRLIVRIQQRKA